MENQKSTIETERCAKANNTNNNNNSAQREKRKIGKEWKMYTKHTAKILALNSDVEERNETNCSDVEQWRTKQKKHSPDTELTMK